MLFDRGASIKRKEQLEKMRVSCSQQSASSLHCFLTPCDEEKCKKESCSVFLGLWFIEFCGVEEKHIEQTSCPLPFWTKKDWFRMKSENLKNEKTKKKLEEAWINARGTLSFQPVRICMVEQVKIVLRRGLRESASRGVDGPWGAVGRRLLHQRAACPAPGTFTYN